MASLKACLWHSMSKSFTFSFGTVLQHFFCWRVLLLLFFILTPVLLVHVLLHFSCAGKWFVTFWTILFGCSPLVHFRQLFCLFVITLDMIFETNHARKSLFALVTIKSLSCSSQRLLVHVYVKRTKWTKWGILYKVDCRKIVDNTNAMKQECNKARWSMSAMKQVKIRVQ